VAYNKFNEQQVFTHSLSFPVYRHCCPSASALVVDSANIDRGYVVKVGEQAPDDFELVLTNGTKTTLKQLRGKIVILQFTASWCSVCRQEMPHLQKDIWEAYKDQGLVLIGVDRDEP